MPTLTSYQSLLLDCQPRPIRSEGAYRKALRQVEKLMRPRLSRAESEMVEVLATLIEQYESREHPTPKSPPREMLAHLIEARGGAGRGIARNRHPAVHRQRGFGRAAETQHSQHRRTIRLLPRVPQRAYGTPTVSQNSTPATHN